MAKPEESVIKALKEYLNSSEWQLRKNKNRDFTDFLSKATEKDIFFGSQPIFLCGNVVGSMTGVGESTFGDTVSQRTVRIDFTTPEYLFIASGNNADKATINEALKRFDYAAKAYSSSNLWGLAYDYGVDVVNDDLRGLNYTPKSHTLRSYDLERTSEDFKCPLWPIFLRYTKAGGKQKNIRIGYWQGDGKDSEIDLNIAPPATGKQKLITAAIIAGVVIILAIILL